MLTMAEEKVVVNVTAQRYLAYVAEEAVQITTPQHVTRPPQDYRREQTGTGVTRP